MSFESARADRRGSGRQGLVRRRIRSMDVRPGISSRLPAPDDDAWIGDRPSQTDVWELLDTLIANLGA
jgi:hypothetical protein